ncbi:MAG: aminoacyl-tRNA hydrolase [Pseudomonadota bacterium]
MKLIVGLGNPGDKYARNRHNVGFMSVEAIASDHDAAPWRRKFQAQVSEVRLGSARALLMKPQTFMNDSGRAVGEAARFLKIATDDIIVIYDEIDLAPGKLKVKTGGGNAGHNGLKSISAHLGNDYIRVRIGVGHPGQKHLVANYVLADFTKADGIWLEPLLGEISTSAPLLAQGDSARFLNDVTRKLAGEGSGRDDRLTSTASRATQATKASDSGSGERSGVNTAQPGERQTFKQAKPANRKPHPAGERADKRATALAENLRAWMAGRDKKR